VLHVAIPETTPEIDQAVMAGKDRMATERALLGVDSAQVGAELAWRWSFPQNIIDAIGQQHSLEAKDDAVPLATLIGLAKQMVNDFNQPLDEAAVQARIPAHTLERLGISLEQITNAMPELKEACTTIDNLL
jgi:HD-like signal output (HDOD) protein